MLGSISEEDIGWLSRDQMVEVDRVMIEHLGIELIQMMENAGRNLAELVIGLYRPKTATVLAGSGGNGGGGLVAARHLTNRGVEVTVCVTSSDLDGVPGHQLQILENMGVRFTNTPDPTADVAIDALVGYTLLGAPRGRVAELIDWLETFGGPVVSLDTPSGLDVDDGSAPGDVVTANATLTLALPKRGLADHVAVGDLFVGDISVPASVYEQMGAGPAPDFGESPILRITR